ncbi:proline/serine-rich protein [Mycena galericulata]|nr:proline/serine-rich protein [Mycena galericulata]
MATPAPALLTPAASRTRDWARTAEPGSAFSGLGRGGRGGGGGGGGGRGRSRGGRGRSGAGGAGTPRAPSTAAVDKPAASEGSTSKPATSTPEKSSVPSTSTTPTRPKGQGRKSSRPVVPTVVVGPSTSSAEVSTSTPRPSNRRRRSQQLNSKGSGNAAALKVNVPSLDDSLLRPQNRLVPHSAPPPSKDTPPHLAGSFDMRNNIDALVERVRAVAMDNRPTTPGSASHIDWAGDDDEGLPDLDDWGVTTGTSVGDKDEMISPIIVDGLKPLPEPVSKPPTPSGDAKDEVIVPFVMEHQQKLPQAAQASLHPSLPPKPVLGPTPNPPRSGRAKITASGKSVPPSTEGLVSQGSTMPAEPEPAVQQPGVKPEEKQEAENASDSGREGLGASIHAPALSNSLSAPSNLSTPPTQPRNFNPTHNRAHTVGRSFPQSAPVNFNPRFSRSGASTPRGSYPGGQHARTHSSPPAGSVLSNHRSPHTRPVITGDAISRLARTIAAPSARTPPISASNI